MLEVERMLPNGFHDAVLNKLSVDYLKKEAVFEIEVLRDTIATEYEKGELTLRGVIFLLIEPPDSQRHFIDSVLYIDSGPIEALNEQVQRKFPTNNLPDNAFIHWIYISPWNSFIIFCAIAAEYKKLGTGGRT